MDSDLDGYYCRAAERCIDGRNVYDPDTRLKVARFGAWMTKPGICDTCTRRTFYALVSLPGAITELSELLEPSPIKTARDPDMPAAPHVMLAPPLPLRPNILDLQTLIDYEVTVWAESVADHLNLPWQPLRGSSRARQYQRVSRCCDLLRLHRDALLALPVQEHRARSLSTRRADGHDPDTTTRYHDDYWTNRDGITGAMILIDLDERAIRVAGRHPGERMNTPCKVCGCLGLIREHRFNKVVCRVCHNDWTDDEHDEFMAGVYDLLGIAQ